jgi:hypothetical protein
MDDDDLLVIQVPSTVLKPTLDRRPRASNDAKIRDRLSTGTAVVRKYRSFADGSANASERPVADLRGRSYERTGSARKRSSP